MDYSGIFIELRVKTFAFRLFLHASKKISFPVFGS